MIIGTGDSPLPTMGKQFANNVKRSQHPVHIASNILVTQEASEPQKRIVKMKEPVRSSRAHHKMYHPLMADDKE